jgi:hypothetical protein
LRVGESRHRGADDQTRTAQGGVQRPRDQQDQGDGGREQQRDLQIESATGLNYFGLVAG